MIIFFFILKMIVRFKILSSNNLYLIFKLFTSNKFKIILIINYYYI